jgi:predicted Zn-ribbon and HTH transcriptional regulator
MPRPPKRCKYCGRTFIPTGSHATRCQACAHEDPPLPSGAKAYLAAFDRYLMETKSTGSTTAAADARQEMRERCDEMVDVAKGRLHRAPFEVCTDCGDAFELPATRGRPPKRCPSCRGVEELREAA